MIKHPAPSTAEFEKVLLEEVYRRADTYIQNP